MSASAAELSKRFIAAVPDGALAPTTPKGTEYVFAAPAMPAARPVAAGGQFSYEAERIPEVKACAAMPQASLVNKGPGFELYSVACRNSDTLMVRCEMGNCRVMR